MVNGWDYISIVPKFLGFEEMHLYASAADLAIENYKQTEFSTSGMSHFMMSYGLPNISSNANILLDFDDKKSLKYDIGDTRKMAENLLKLIRDKKLCKKISRNCLEYTKEVSWPNISKRHLKLYKGLMK